MQRDYVMRMIEQMAAVIAQIRKRLLGGGVEAEVEVRQLAAAHGVDLDTLRAVDGETLLLLLNRDGAPDVTRSWITAEVLYLEGLRLEAGGDVDEAQHVFAKALLLYEMIDVSMLSGLPEAGDRIAELRLRLHVHPL